MSTRLMGESSGHTKSNSTPVNVLATSRLDDHPTVR